MPDDNSPSGLMALAIVVLITAVMLIAIWFNGDMPFRDGKMFISVTDKFTDDTSNTYYVNVDKVLVKNVTYYVSSEDVYKKLEPGKGYTVMYDKRNRTITGVVTQL